MIVPYFVAFGLFVLLFTREVIAPASGATCDKRWRIYAGAINASNIVVVVGAGYLFSGWIAEHSLLTLPASSGPLGNSLIIFLVASFCAYWWHRLTHASKVLWRMVHQLHHSPARVEALTAFYLHPLDSFLAAMLNALIAYFVLGATGLEAGLALAYTVVFNLVAHADIKTPWALGLVLQRPEMHRQHHESGQHKNNYGLPLWDMLFGTWRNPRERALIACGFAADKEVRIGDMLLMRDIEG